MYVNFSQVIVHPGSVFGYLKFWYDSQPLPGRGSRPISLLVSWICSLRKSPAPIARGYTHATQNYFFPIYIYTYIHIYFFFFGKERKREKFESGNDRRSSPSHRTTPEPPFPPFDSHHSDDIFLKLDTIYEIENNTSSASSEKN